MIPTIATTTGTTTTSRSWLAVRSGRGASGACMTSREANTAGTEELRGDYSNPAARTAAMVASGV